MSVVSYCPFRGKKATGLNGTEKAFAIVSICHKQNIACYPVGEELD